MNFVLSIDSKQMLVKYYFTGICLLIKNVKIHSKIHDEYNVHPIPLQDHCLFF